MCVTTKNPKRASEFLVHKIKETLPHVSKTSGMGGGGRGDTRVSSKLKRGDPALNCFREIHDGRLMGKPNPLGPNCGRARSYKRGPVYKGGGLAHVGGPDAKPHGDMWGAALKHNLRGVAYTGERTVNNKKVQGGGGGGGVTGVVNRGKNTEGGEDTGRCGRDCSGIVIEIAPNNERLSGGSKEVEYSAMTI
jgi:hypothetical protein